MNMKQFLDRFRLFCILFISAMIILASFRIFNLMMEKTFTTMEIRGQFGDQFGVLNALFSCLALIGLIITIAVQSRDLRIQTKAFELQMKEFQKQQEELARSAKAQEGANILNLTSMKIHLGNMHLQMDLERIKMMGDIKVKADYYDIIEKRIELSYADLEQLEKFLGIKVNDNGDQSKPTTDA